MSSSQEPQDWKLLGTESAEWKLCIIPESFIGQPALNSLGSSTGLSASDPGKEQARLRKVREEDSDQMWELGTHFPLVHDVRR